MSDVIKKAVMGIIAEELGVVCDSFDSEQMIVDDLGADSLDIMTIVMKLEDEFVVDIQDEQIFESMRVVHLIGVIEELVDKKNNKVVPS